MLPAAEFQERLILAGSSLRWEKKLCGEVVNETEAKKTRLEIFDIIAS